MDTLLSTLRKTKDSNDETLSNLAGGFLIFFLLVCGYILFFYNPVNILNYIRTPLIILYILLITFVSLFMFKRMKQEPLFNISFELTTHTFTFGKMLLLVFIIFVSFYIFYKLMIHIILKTMNISIFLSMTILIVVLAIINSYTKIADNEITNEVVDFIKDLIFYIPCLLIDAIEFMKQDYENTPSTIIILFIMLYYYFFFFRLIIFQC
jgi:hypothetical protein